MQITLYTLPPPGFYSASLIHLPLPFHRGPALGSFHILLITCWSHTGVLGTLHILGHLPVQREHSLSMGRALSPGQEDFSDTAFLLPNSAMKTTTTVSFRRTPLEWMPCGNGTAFTTSISWHRCPMEKTWTSLTLRISSMHAASMRQRVTRRK